MEEQVLYVGFIEPEEEPKNQTVATTTGINTRDRCC